MSGFSKAIESILKSFSKPAQKQAGEISANNAKTHATKPNTQNNAIMPNQNPQRQGMQAKTKNKPAQKQIHKEQRGIYNVTYNGKNATIIKQDLDSLQEAILGCVRA